MSSSIRLGATCLADNRCQFEVWAPLAQCVELRIFNNRESATSLDGLFAQDSRLIRLQVTDRGYHTGSVDDSPPGTRYACVLDQKVCRPDPAACFQPLGVHGPSEVINLHSYQWNDAVWQGLPLDDFIIYEVHVGTYTAEGTFAGIIPYLPELKNLGITALELMPVAQFPGKRNWGYDGVYPFAVQNSYGGPAGLQMFVDACHAHGIAVVLDVVYNHLGPEGNYLGDFGPYFTGRYRSLWGQAINFDGPQSDEVVRFFMENALHWVRDFHIDALRLDAIHGIVDCNAQPFLRLLAEAVHEFAGQSGRKIYLIAESDLNDVRFIQPAGAPGGYGLDAQWSDDFHHALHALVTGETSGYYSDFGEMGHLKTAIKEGFVYSGQYSVYRRRRHGSCSCTIPGRQFVVFAQNHDQVGNRLFGDRLNSLVSLESSKLAAGMVILSANIPLLFMGEEWGDPAPFTYFISHSDATLIEAVRRGRKQEFSNFRWQGEPPDPQDEATFFNCIVDHVLKQTEPHRTLWEFYQGLIKLRRTVPALACLSKDHLEVRIAEADRTLEIRRWTEDDQALLLANFSDGPRSVRVAGLAGTWCKRLDTAERRWAGPGSAVPNTLRFTQETVLTLNPKSFSVFQKSE